MAARSWLLALGLVLVALNLRPVFTSVSPVAAQVQQGLGLSASTLGLLTTVTVLCLGVFAPLAPRLAIRFGTERTVLGMLLLLAGGTALRGALGSFGLFAGALLAGAAIGVIGVLLPSIIKRDFPQRVGLMMGLYSMSLCLGAALAAGATVPLGEWLGGDWRHALAAWGAFALVGALAWLPQLRAQDPQQGTNQADVGLWRDGLAWAVSLYMGLQSALAYSVFAWLPPILVDRGLSPLEAGFLLSVSVMSQLVTAFGGSWLALRFGSDQRPTLCLMLLLALVGLLGCLHAPLESILPWVVLLGLGQGGQFSVALLLIVLRSRDTPTAARLSGMSQGVGYTLAALGPVAAGLLHDFSGSWSSLGMLFAALTVAAGASGWIAAQNRYVGAVA